MVAVKAQQKDLDLVVLDIDTEVPRLVVFYYSSTTTNHKN
jgi:hypothetical protein